MTQKLSSNRLGRRNAHNADRIELAVGAVRPSLNTLFCMWAWQLNLLLALPAKQA